MTHYYADSSALVKRHVVETGSAWLIALADPSTGNRIITSRVSIIEVYSAFNRRVREATVTALDYTQIAADFAATYTAEYNIKELTQQVTNKARLVLETHPLRAYDSIHLATAQVVSDILTSSGSRACVFLTADDRLLSAAMAEGMPVDNPNSHP